MALNKFNKKTTLQLTLLAVGILLVFLTYFSKPIKDKNQEVLENIDQTKKGIEEEKDTSFFEDVEYKGTDNAGNKFVIFSEYSDFKKDRPEIINMKKILCYFYFKDGTVLEIRSETGVYNNLTLDMGFAKNVNMFYMDNSLFSDRADFSNENNRLSIEGSVKTQSPDGGILADKLNFDFVDKKLKISMYDNEEKVNVKTKLR